jgi:HD-GYP domain-containing protein (c-di-GMP phosphodiesterase class II)
MRRILTQNLTPGMKLARPIYASDARVLLGEGVEVQTPYITRLLDMGIMSVYIEDEISQGIKIQDIVSEQTRIEAINAIRDLTSNFMRGKGIDARLAKQRVNSIVDDLFYTKDILVNMVDLRTKSDYTFCHMVNVAILSVMTGIALGYNELRLRDLGVGALLHDLGKLKVDESIYNKSDALTAQEYESIKKHSHYGFEMIRQIEDVSVLCAHIAFQHHERYDGQRYPRGLTAEEIHECARIVAVADVFDALTAQRPYRKAMLPYHAVEYLVAMAGTQFDPNLVKAFIDHIAIYPTGSIVELNTQQKAIVVSVNKMNKTRPVVRIFQDESAQRLPKPLEIDLMTHPTVFINRMLEE